MKAASLFETKKTILFAFFLFIFAAPKHLKAEIVIIPENNTTVATAELPGGEQTSPARIKIADIPPTPSGDINEPNSSITSIIFSNGIFQTGVDPILTPDGTKLLVPLNSTYSTTSFIPGGEQSSPAMLKIVDVAAAMASAALSGGTVSEPDSSIKTVRFSNGILQQDVDILVKSDGSKVLVPLNNAINLASTVPGGEQTAPMRVKIVDVAAVLAQPAGTITEPHTAIASVNFSNGIMQRGVDPILPPSETSFIVALNRTTALTTAIQGGEQTSSTRIKIVDITAAVAAAAASSGVVNEPHSSIASINFADGTLQTDIDLLITSDSSKLMIPLNRVVNFTVMLPGGEQTADVVTKIVNVPAAIAAAAASSGVVNEPHSSIAAIYFNDGSILQRGVDPLLTPDESRLLIPSNNTTAATMLIHGGEQTSTARIKAIDIVAAVAAAAATGGVVNEPHASIASINFNTTNSLLYGIFQTDVDIILNAAGSRIIAALNYNTALTSTVIGGEQTSPTRIKIVNLSSAIAAATAGGGIVSEPDASITSVTFVDGTLQQKVDIKLTPDETKLLVPLDNTTVATNLIAGGEQSPASRVKIVDMAAAVAAGTSVVEPHSSIASVNFSDGILQQEIEVLVTSDNSKFLLSLNNTLTASQSIEGGEQAPNTRVKIVDIASAVVAAAASGGTITEPTAPVTSVNFNNGIMQRGVDAFFNTGESLMIIPLNNTTVASMAVPGGEQTSPVRLKVIQIAPAIAAPGGVVTEPHTSIASYNFQNGILQIGVDGSGFGLGDTSDPDADSPELYIPDFGDAPDAPYPSLLASNGPSHDDFFQEWFGPSVSGEVDSRQPPSSDTYDDGVSILFNKFIENTPNSMFITVSNSASPVTGRYDTVAPFDPDKLMYVNAYADWNNNGTWAAAGPPEKIIGSGSTNMSCVAVGASPAGLVVPPAPLPVDTIALNAPGSFKCFVTPPLGTAGSSVWVRVRLDYGEDTGIYQKVNPTLLEEVGKAQYGEVEDHQFPVVTSTTDPGDPEDLGDAYDGTCAGGPVGRSYPSCTGNPKGFAEHTNPSDEWLGGSVDTEVESIQPDADDTPADGGVVLDNVYTPKGTGEATFTVSYSPNWQVRFPVGNKIFVKSWFDWNHNDDWSDNEHMFTWSGTPGGTWTIAGGIAKIVSAKGAGGACPNAGFGAGGVWNAGTTKCIITVRFEVPDSPSDLVNDYFARFRLVRGTNVGVGALKPTGISPNGEVEDWKYKQFINIQTAVTLSSLTAARTGEEMVVNWTTGSEMDNEGFNLFRSETASGGFIKVNTKLIAANGGVVGHSYRFVDRSAEAGKTYFYRLEDIDSFGKSNLSYLMASTIRRPEVVPVAIPNVMSVADNPVKIEPVTVTSYFTHLEDRPESNVTPEDTSLRTFTISSTKDGVAIRWSAADEEISGFNILRSKYEDGQYLQVNDTLIEPLGEGKGKNRYSYLDKVLVGHSYYKIEVIRNDGSDNAITRPVAALEARR